MSGLSGKIIKGAWAAVTKKVTTLEPDGEGGEEAITRTKVRPGVKWAGWALIALALLYHLIGRPILCHHYPDADFPSIEDMLGLLSSLFMGL